MGNRTFLPLRTLADLLGLPIDFDPETNTVHLGNRFAGQRRPLTEAAPHFDTGGGGWRVGAGVALDGGTSVAALDSVSMGGSVYHHALWFNTTVTDRSGGLIGGSAASNRFTLHNLNGQFRMLTGYVGRVDGSHMTNATISFIGDGQLLQSYNLSAADMPIPISVFVDGVSQLRIEVLFAARISRNATAYALVAFLE